MPVLVIKGKLMNLPGRVPLYIEFVADKFISGFRQNQIHRKCV